MKSVRGLLLRFPLYIKENREKNYLGQDYTVQVLNALMELVGKVNYYYNQILNSGNKQVFL